LVLEVQFKAGVFLSPVWQTVNQTKLCASSIAKLGSVESFLQLIFPDLS